MPASIKPVRLNHMNFVLEDVEQSLAHFRSMFGADQLADMPQEDLHAYLIDIGRVIFEAFVPNQFLVTARYGPHYVGVEYQANMDEVRNAVAGHGLRIVRDIGLALHTHPADCFGVAFEFYDGYFHDRTWDMLGGEKMKPAEYWSEEHPLGLTGLNGYTWAVHDIEAASRFAQSFLSAIPVYEEARDAIGGRAVGLQVADSMIELLAPEETGSLQDHLSRHGEGIRSTVFQVRDIDLAKAYFAERGISTVAGAQAESIALCEADNAGVMFEFTN